MAGNVKDSWRLFLLKQLSSEEKVMKPIRKLVRSLDEQGVLNSFVQRERLKELNAALREKIPDFRPYLLDDGYISAFETILLQRIGSNVYERKKTKTSVEDVCEATKSLDFDTNWAVVFEYIYGLAYMMKTFGYRKEVGEYDRIPGVTINEVAKVRGLYKETFLLGSVAEVPSKEWMNEHKDLAVLVCIDPFLNTKFENDAFDNIAKNYSKPVKRDEREVIELMTVSTTESILLARIVMELTEEGKEITEEAVTERYTRIAFDTPMQIWSLYYVTLMHMFELVHSGK